jgi:hypothetical protein
VVVVTVVPVVVVSVTEVTVAVVVVADVVVVWVAVVMVVVVLVVGTHTLQRRGHFSCNASPTTRLLHSSGALLAHESASGIPLHVGGAVAGASVVELVEDVYDVVELDVLVVLQEVQRTGQLACSSGPNTGSVQLASTKSAQNSVSGRPLHPLGQLSHIAGQFFSNVDRKIWFLQSFGAKLAHSLLSCFPKHSPTGRIVVVAGEYVVVASSAVTVVVSGKVVAGASVMTLQESQRTGHFASKIGPVNSALHNALLAGQSDGSTSPLHVGVVVEVVVVVAVVAVEEEVEVDEDELVEVEEEVDVVVEVDDEVLVDVDVVHLPHMAGQTSPTVGPKTSSVQSATPYALHSS